MTEDQIQLLKKALDLYRYSIELRKEGIDCDLTESLAFHEMRQKLSEILGKNVSE